MYSFSRKFLPYDKMVTNIIIFVNIMINIVSATIKIIGATEKYGNK